MASYGATVVPFGGVAVSTTTAAVGASCPASAGISSDVCVGVGIGVGTPSAPAPEATVATPPITSVVPSVNIGTIQGKRREVGGVMTEQCARDHPWDFLAIPDCGPPSIRAVPDSLGFANRA